MTDQGKAVVLAEKQELVEAAEKALEESVVYKPSYACDHDDDKHCSNCYVQEPNPYVKEGLLESALEFIREIANSAPSDDMDWHPSEAENWLFKNKQPLKG